MSEAIANQQRLTIPVDSEHAALRLTVVAIFVVGSIITYAVTNSLIVSEGLNIIAVIIAFVVGGVVARLSESTLQRLWPSGRVVEIDERGVRTLKNTTVQQEIRADQPVSALVWRFQTKRRSRVPKGWYVLALALEQDDNYLPIYTFASPEDAAKFDKISRFTDLVSEKEAKSRDTRQDSLRFAGEQRRLRLAETHRWTNGAEMSLEDFERFITRLNGQFQQWMP